MNYLLIDPKVQALSEVAHDEGDFLEFVRTTVGCPQVAVMPLHNGAVAIWCDSMGMLKPGRDFWSFRGDAYRFAGRCIITGVDAQTGMPGPLPALLTADRLSAGVQWHPSTDLVHIIERIEVIPNEDGRPVPIIARLAEWKNEELPEPEDGDDVGSGWTVYEREDGTYKAIRMALEGDELRPVAMLSAPNLDALRAALPAGLIRIEADEREDAVEHWMVPIPEEEG